MPVSTVTTTLTTTTAPASRVLSTVHEKTPSNKGITDLSTVKYYNYNKFSHYATSCTQPRTKRTRTELARVEQGLESDSESSAVSSDSEN
jgi:hypothetical protein